MGKPKNRWTREEERALVAGVDKYGSGRWKDILADQRYAPCLINRSNVDLKDKWRNLTSNATSSGVPHPSPPDKGLGLRHNATIFRPPSSSHNLEVIDVDAIYSDNEKANRIKIISHAGPNIHANCNERQRKNSIKTLEDIALDAANRIKEAERMARETAEACRDVESLRKIAEESMVLQNLANELHAICSTGIAT